MVTEYIFGEIFPSQGILYKVIDGIGKYIAFLRNMNPIRREESTYNDLGFDGIVRGEVQLEPVEELQST